jgi:hypothetical protein
MSTSSEPVLLRFKVRVKDLIGVRGFPEISAICGSLASGYNPAFVTAEGTIAGAEAAL